MKNRKLKKWVKVVLKIMFVLAFLVGASDCQDTKVFVISHIIAGLIMVLSGYILVKNMEE